MASGAQCVMIIGHLEKLMSSADHWAMGQRQWQQRMRILEEEWEGYCIIGCSLEWFFIKSEIIYF